MHKFQVKACALLLSVSAVSVTGCFGESILSAGSKVLGGQISQLTPGEILILNQTASDLISQVTGLPGTTLTTPQAVAISNFLQVNELDTLQDFETLATNAESDPESIQGLEELGSAFEGTDYEGDEGEFDAGQLGDLFGSILGGVDQGSLPGGTSGPGGPTGPGGPNPGLN